MPRKRENPAAVEAMRPARKAGTDPELAGRGVAPRHGGQRGTRMEVGELPPPVPPSSEERPPSRSGPPLCDEHQITRVYHHEHLRALWDDSQTTSVYGPEATETIRQETCRATHVSATEPRAPVRAAPVRPASARSRTPSTALPLASHAATPGAKPFGSDTVCRSTPKPRSDEKVGGLVLDEAEMEALTRRRGRISLAVLVAGAMLFGELVFFVRSEPVAHRDHLMTTTSDIWRPPLDVPFRPHQH